MFNKLNFNQHLFSEQIPAKATASGSVTTSDSFSYVAEFFRTVSDSVTSSQTFAYVASFFRTLLDNIFVSDSLLDKVFNKMKSAPTILSASMRRFFAGSSSFIRPERG